MVTLYNVVSADGFIARPDGNEDFIPDSLWPRTLELFSRYDTVAMGRKTYEALQAYPDELLKPFEALPVKKVVVSRDPDFKLKSGYALVRSPREACALGENVLVTSGPTLNGSVVDDKLAEKVILHRLPVKIGEGVKPFPFNPEHALALESERPLGDGVVESIYRIS